jgi:hypothetical protein
MSPLIFFGAIIGAIVLLASTALFFIFRSGQPLFPNMQNLPDALGDLPFSKKKDS